MSQAQTQIPQQPQAQAQSKDAISTLKKQASKSSLKNIPSLSNLYNSTSNSGSSSNLSYSNSAVFNNNAGLVQKGTIAHIDNSHLHNNINNSDDDDSAFELNWTPQVSSDNYTSGYHQKY